MNKEKIDEINDNQKMSFAEYKIKVVEDDIKKMEIN